MADLKRVNCGKKAKNTGDNRCRIEFELLQGYVALPNGREYTPEETLTGDTFMAAIQEDLRNPKPELRAYLFIGPSTTAAPTYTEATSETDEYGRKYSRLDQQADLMFTFRNKGQCWYSAAIAFDRQQGNYTYLLIGRNGTIAGYKLSNGNTIGFVMSDVLVNASTIPTGSTGTIQTHKLTFNNYQNDWGEDAVFIETDNAANDLRGLADFYLNDITQLVSPVVVGTYWVQVLGSCGGADLASTYQSLFEAETAGHPWIAYNNTTGPTHAIIISAAVYHATPYPGATAGAIAIAFDVTDTDWTAGDDVNLSVEGTAGLNTDGMIDFEANPNNIILPN